MFKSTSFHKVLIPALVSDIPETTHNLEVILDAMNISQLSKTVKIVGDMKLYLLLLGLTSVGSMYSCPYGHCHRVDSDGNRTGKYRGSTWVLGVPRTIGSLLENHIKWATETDSNPSLLKHYFNCKYPPVIPGEESEEVINILSIPFLHTVLLGPFNSLWEAWRVVGGESLTQWMQQNRMKGLRGDKDFNGPTIKQIIHSESTLSDLEDKVDNSRLFVSTLRSLGKLHNLVRAKDLVPEFKSIILDFCDNWDQLLNEHPTLLSHTLKVHIIRDHLADRLEATGESLLKESDETTEQVHHRYRQFSERHQYGVNNLTSPAFFIKQAKALSHWNSQNM